MKEPQPQPMKSPSTQPHFACPHTAPQKLNGTESSKDPNGWRGKYLRALHICPPELSFQSSGDGDWCKKEQQMKTTKSKTTKGLRQRVFDHTPPATEPGSSVQSTTTTITTTTTTTTTPPGTTTILKRRNSFAQQVLFSATRVAIAKTSRRFRRRCQTEFEGDLDALSAPIEIPVTSCTSRRSHVEDDSDDDDIDHLGPSDDEDEIEDDDDEEEEEEEEEEELEEDGDEPEDDPVIFEMEGVPSSCVSWTSPRRTSRPVVRRSRATEEPAEEDDDNQCDLSASFVPPHELVEHDCFSYERRYRRRCALRI